MHELSPCSKRTLLVIAERYKRFLLTTYLPAHTMLPLGHRIVLHVLWLPARAGGLPRKEQTMRFPNSLVISWIFVSTALLSSAQTNNQNNPTWWSKLQYLVNHPPANNEGPTSSVAGVNVDVSNECGPQS